MDPFHNLELCERLVLPIKGICPLKKFSGVGVDAEGGFLIIDCACQLKGTASLRA